MAIRSEGEFELVLGNRQLFSVLGIVVILLGIFFAMGFFAGKSVGQASAGATTARRSGEQNPLVVDSPPSNPPASTPAAVPAVDEAAAPAADSSSKTEEKPASQEKEPSTTKKADPAAAKPATSKNGDQVVKPPNGSYLQVASTRLSEAQSLAALLRKHQFHVFLAESSKPELVRVLVGPFSSSDATAEARAKLKSLDIPNVIPRKFPSKD